jgi:hypothetical protein
MVGLGEQPLDGQVAERLLSPQEQDGRQAAGFEQLPEGAVAHRRLHAEQRPIGGRGPTNRGAGGGGTGAIGKASAVTVLNAGWHRRLPWGAMSSRGRPDRGKHGLVRQASGAVCVRQAA